MERMDKALAEVRDEQVLRRKAQEEKEVRRPVQEAATIHRAGMSTVEEKARKLHIDNLAKELKENAPIVAAKNAAFVENLKRKKLSGQIGRCRVAEEGKFEKQTHAQIFLLAIDRQRAACVWESHQIDGESSRSRLVSREKK